MSNDPISAVFGHCRGSMNKIAKKSNRRNRVKTTLFAAALVVTLTLSAAAAQKKPSQHLAGNANVQGSAAIQVPPPACDPCAFYGGDFDPSSPNATGLSSENTLLIPGSSTYGNFNVPTGFTLTVTGVLFNLQ